MPFLPTPGPRRFVLDTNAVVAALRSSQGASFALVAALPVAGWELAVSVSLFLEWEDVLSRPEMTPGTSAPDRRRFVDGIVAQAHLQEIHFRWPSRLPDPKDDMVLELAVAARAEFIVTFNRRHFPSDVLAEFGVQALAPREFLRVVGLRP